MENTKESKSILSILVGVWNDASYAGKIWISVFLVSTAIVAAATISWGMWLIGFHSIFALADSYAYELGLYIPLSAPFLKAITYALFLVLFPIAGLLASWKSGKLKAGIFLFSILNIGFYVVLGVASKDFKVSPLGDDPIKCLVKIDGQNIIYDIVPGRKLIDPVTSKPCVPITSELAQKITRRPANRLPLDTKEAYFDVTDGSVRVWYSRMSDGTIELFDNEGSHPLTREEHLQITKEIGEEIKSMIRLQFEEKTKAAEFKLQQERQAKAELERLGQEEEEKRKEEAIAAKVEAGRVEQEELRIKQEEQFALEQQSLEDARQETEKKIQLQEVLNICDRLAGNRYDPDRNTDYIGVTFAELSTNVEKSTLSCRNAVSLAPGNLRQKYQLARALQARKSKEAQSLLVELVNEDYVAAFDNLAAINLRAGRNSEAINFYRRGVELGSAEAMYSLAVLFLDGSVVRKDRDNAKRLLQEAVRSGHIEAKSLLKDIKRNELVGDITGAVAGALLRKLLND